MEHSDLVAEMSQVEHLTTQERLHLAKRRRIQQLKLWASREREWLRSRASAAKGKGAAAALAEKVQAGRRNRNIFFSDSVMLLEAAARNDIDEVRRLLSKGVTPDATNEDGLTALHQCCIDNNEEMLRLLIDKGANVNAEDSEKWTPLHAAATCGHLQLVRTLIQRGANLLAVNADGNMPYDICEDESSLDCIEGEMAARGVTQRLIDATRGATERQMLRDLRHIATQGGDLEVVDQHGATPLHIAAANGYIKVVEFLLDNHVSTDVKDNDMWQPVHAAACWGHMEVLETLVHNGADLNAKNKHDETPADICEDPDMRLRIAQLLTERETRTRVSGSSSTGGTGPGGRKGTPGARLSSSRAHSVRRTSLRERGKTAKQDAHDEARMRDTFAGGAVVGLPNGSETTQAIPNGPTSPQKRSSNGSGTGNPGDPGGSSNPPPAKQPATTSHNAATQNGDAHSHKSSESQASSNTVPKITNPLYGVNAASQYLPNANPKSPDGVTSPATTPQNQLYNGFNKNDSPTQQQYNSRLSSDDSESVVAMNNNGVRKAPEGQDNESFVHEDELDSAKELMEMPTETSAATHYTTDNNGKINVHVTVMINAGTLADLKKQRSQIRNTSPTDVGAFSGSDSGGSPRSTSVSSPPPINHGDVPRFSGHTSEVVGDARSHRCCIIM